MSKPPIHLGRVVDLAAIFHGRERNVKPGPGDYSQLWRCIPCRAVRQWGYGEREGTVSPFLVCEGECGVHTPHVYVGVR
jgi:hypothetical protein